MATERKKFTFENLVSIYFRKIHKIIFTNLLFALPFGVVGFLLHLIGNNFGSVFNIVITTLVIPICYPLYAGVTKVTRNLGRSEDVDVFATFINGVTENYKQFLIHSIILYFVFTIGVFSFSFYAGMAKILGGSMYVMLVVEILIALWVLFMYLYIPLMTVTFELSEKDILKNSALMAIGELKVNFAALFSLAILTAICATPLIFCMGNGVAVLVVSAIMLLLIYPASFSLVSNFFIQENMMMMITGKADLIHDRKSTEEKLAQLRNDSKEDFSDVDVEKVKKSKEDFIFHNGKMIKRDVLLQMIEEKESEKNE